MKKYVIISKLDSFNFPLREATRKQIWWTAVEKQKQGYETEIILLLNEVKEFTHENIKIRYVNQNFWNPFLKKDIIHIMTGTVSLWLIFSFFWFGKKKLTLMDGEMIGYKNQKARLFFVKFLSLIFRKIIVYSNYQKSILKLGKSCFIEKPILPIININSKIKRSQIPTLLYMGHLSYFKGVDTIIFAFKKLIIDIPNLVLIIANNSIQGDTELINEVADLKKSYPNNIILKGIVDPIEELSTAWVYLYPFKKAIGTMAYALSLYEAEQCNIPYIACDVGANKEFFNNEYLINVNDGYEMVKKIKSLIYERKIQRHI